MVRVQRDTPVASVLSTLPERALQMVSMDFIFGFSV